MPKPSPRGFREDVLRVEKKREPWVHLKQIAADFGISESCFIGWLTNADAEYGIKSGLSSSDSEQLREVIKRIRLLEQENEVLRRASAYLSQANLPKI